MIPLLSSPVNETLGAVVVVVHDRVFLAKTLKPRVQSFTFDGFLHSTYWVSMIPNKATKQ
jgi:hypothetical protein